MFVTCSWFQLSVNHSEQNNGRARGEKTGGLCKYLSGMDVDLTSLLLRSLPVPAPSDQVATGSVNIDFFTSALQMDADHTSWKS